MCVLKSSGVYSVAVRLCFGRGHDHALFAGINKRYFV